MNNRETPRKITMSRLSYLYCDFELNAANGQMEMKFDELGFKLIFERDSVRLHYRVVGNVLLGSVVSGGKNADRLILDKMGSCRSG